MFQSGGDHHVARKIRKRTRSARSRRTAAGPLKHTRTAALASRSCRWPRSPSARRSTSRARPAASAARSSTIRTTTAFRMPASRVFAARASRSSTPSTERPYEFTVATNEDGLYDFGTGSHEASTTISVQIPPDTTPSPTDRGGRRRGGQRRRSGWPRQQRRDR